MKKGLLGLLFLCTLPSMQAQDLKIHVNQKGKVGFVNSRGDVVINCDYESATPFSDGISIVMKSEKYGIIDTSGKVILPVKYSSITSWTDKLFLIKDGKDAGLANHQGEIVLKPEYSHISKLNCYNKALIADGGKVQENDRKKYMNGAKYGIIDQNGKILIEPEYRGFYEFSFDGKDKNPLYEGQRLQYSYHYLNDTLVTDCEYIGFSKNGSNIYEAGLMDGHGKELIEPGEFTFIMLPRSNMVRYYVNKKKETLCGYYNLETGKSFEAVTFDKAFNDMNYWSHGDFIGNIAPVNGSSWSFIDKTGAVIRKGYSSLIHSEATGLWAAKNASGTWEVFDDFNKDVESLSGYGEILFPASKADKQVFCVIKDGLYGAIDKSGQTVVPFVYDKILKNSFDVIPVRKDGKWGAVTADNTPLISCEYEDMILPSEKDAMHYWVMKSDSLYYHLNLYNHMLSNNGYKLVNNYKDGIALVAPADFTIPDNKLNRAQLFAPHASQKQLDEADLSKSKNSFGYLVGEDDKILCDLPISTIYSGNVIQAIKEKGNRALTESEAKDILLKATISNRSYDIQSVLSEAEWNY